MSRAFFPKIPKIRHGHFFDVTGIFSKNVTGTKKNVTGKKTLEGTCSVLLQQVNKNKEWIKDKLLRGTVVKTIVGE